MESDGEPPQRPTARVVLIGPGDRVLLFRWDNKERGHPVWFTPGGGVHAGETYEAAALRELREEVGVEGADLGPCVWTREHLLTLGGRSQRLMERFFVVRVESPRVDTSGFDESEAKEITGHRWMSVEEIAAMSDVVAPRRMADLLPAVLRGDYPTPPVDASD